MSKPNIIALDLETTGLGEKGERVVPVQIAAIALDENLNELGRFQTFLKIPERAEEMKDPTLTLGEMRVRAAKAELPLATYVSLKDGAVLEAYAMDKVHAPKGRTYEWFQEHGVAPEVAYREFVAFCQQYQANRLVPLGQNAAKFDVPMLVRELLLNVPNLVLKKERDGSVPSGKLLLDLDHHVLDTVVLAYAKYVYGTGELKKVSLKPLCDFLGVPLEESDAHDAMNDIVATIECYKILQRRIAPQTFNEAKEAFGPVVEQLVLAEANKIVEGWLAASRVDEARKYLQERLAQHPFLGKLLGVFFKKILA